MRHGFWHFWLIQASFSPHSEFVIHSGLQDGGDPIILGRHEQIAWPLGPCLHCEFKPHCDGKHGLMGTSFGFGKAVFKNL